MKKALIILFSIYSCLAASQTIDNPDIDSIANGNTGIIEIKKTPEKTIVHIIYRTSEQFINGGWFNISPNTEIKESNGSRTYKILNVEGIPFDPEKKVCDFGGQLFSFRLIFPAIAADIEKIDIIECNSLYCFNFIGISLIKNNEEVANTLPERFRIDCSVYSEYNRESGTWSEWEDEYNSFVMNYNNNGDVAHYKANGDIVMYKKISEIYSGYANSGEGYQTLTVIDEDGVEFNFQLFDDHNIGIKLIYSNKSIQFSK